MFLAEERLIMFVGKFNFFLRKLLAQDLSYSDSSSKQSGYFWALFSWGLLLPVQQWETGWVEQRQRESPYKEVVSSWNHYGKDRLFIPKEASEEQNEMHFRGNIFSLAPTLLVKVYPHKE